jgi:2-dehydro-3-deoxygalactonokinase
MTHFISCDWGTSRFRLRLIERHQERIVAEHATDQGIQILAAAHPGIDSRREMMGTVLDHGIAALGVGGQTDIPVVISGMASSTLGWQSLPYATLPAPIDGSTLSFLDFQLSGRKVRLVSGLRADSDIMRGEETELIGLFASSTRRPLAESSIVVMPGTHSKHVHLRAGQIVDFTTYLTGELYALLNQSSTLSAPEPDNVIFDQTAFMAGTQSSRSRGLSAALFQTRALTVLGHLAAKHSRSFLSGALIGAEIAALAGASADQIVLAAGGQLAGQYVLALGELLPKAVVVQIPAAELAAATVAGHARILSCP